MKIGMVVHSYYPADVRVRRECEALADRGDTVDLVCLSRPTEAPREQVGNVAVYRVPIQHRRGQSPIGYVFEYAAFFLHAFLLVTRLHVRHRYPVFQVHNMPDFLVFVTLVPKVLGARVLLDMHDVTPELYQSLYGLPESSPIYAILVLVEQMSLAYADAVLTVNRKIRDLFLTRNPIARKMEVVMNAPDPRYFRAERSGMLTPCGAFRLFHHGQILRRYCFETALNGFALARDRIPELELDIYGDGEEGYIQELKDFVARNGMEGCVRFHGRVPVEQIPELIRRSHVGLVPCHKDVFVDKVMLPVRLLEYVVMELPAVVSRVGTVEAYFKDDEVAYYRHDDPGEMADRIVELYTDPRGREELAQRARAAFKEYDWPRMRDRYYRVIDDLARA